MINPTSIAIDGPVASGKTVVGRLVADQLGFRFLDTGIMYRAVTWIAIRNEIDPKDENAIGRLAESIEIQLIACDSGEKLLIDGEHVNDYLRESQVEHNVSLVSRISTVRSAMVKQQRSIADSGPVVMVGRDIGTVVLSNASVKIFLKASVDVRAKRRYEEMVRRGTSIEFGEVIEELKRRDHLDTERADSPLVPANDAVLINTDNLTVEQVSEKILSLVESH